jgi:hypothetical protein
VLKRSALVLFLAFLLVAVVAAFIPAGPAAASPGTVNNFPSWTAVNNFVPPQGAAKASAGFQGTLSFTTTQMHVTPTPQQMKHVLWGDYRHPWALWNSWGYSFDWLAATDPPGAVPLYDLDATLFPGLEVQFFTTKNGDLVPVQRGIIRRPVKDRTASFWEIILGPGKVWKADAGADTQWSGWNKAAFPFSLVQSQEGEALLGLAFFYYRGSQVSQLCLQISQDSAGGFIFWDNDFTMRAWAQVDTHYSPDTIAQARLCRLQAAYQQEMAGRWPMRSLSELGDAVDGMGAGVDQTHILTTAMVVDDTIYYSPVRTPFGDYPYPEAMRVGVWSATKSLIPGLAALRLAQKYGTGFLDTRIVDYFKPSEYTFASDEAARRWKMVTIWDALHMTTGMGPAGYDANWAADSLNTYQWSYSFDLADQIRYYFNEEPNPNVTRPGQAFYYMDQDMWIAGLAMQRFLQQKEGPGATLLKMLDKEVFKPIGVGHFATGTVYTDTGDVGFPYCGWGALPTLEYLAKAGRLVAAMGRSEDGRQILDKSLIADFFTNPDYQYSFWKTEYTNGSGEQFHVPSMEGAGGNYVLSMPNGLVGIALGCNSYNFSWDEAQMATIVAAADRIRPF